MKKIALSLFISLLFLLGCSVTSETVRDPSKKGFILAERMVQKGRYHDGILLHKINADFFKGHSYAKKSSRRIKELNELLIESTKGRAAVEVTKNIFLKKRKRLFLFFTIVNNTDRKIKSLSFEIQLFNPKGRILMNPKTRRKFFYIERTKALGAWDIADIYYRIQDYSLTNLSKAQIQITKGFYQNNEAIEFNKE